MLDRLEAMGYIRRRRSDTDRRKIIIHRTEKDKATEKQYARLSEQMTQIWYRGFGDAEIDRFEACLQRILDNLVEFENGVHTPPQESSAR